MTAGLIGVLILLLDPLQAVGCPSCAAGRDGGAASSIAIGLMILLPFFVIGVVFYLIPKGEWTSSPMASEQNPKITEGSE